MAQAARSGRTWYALTVRGGEEADAGARYSGRRYASRITQLITTRTGHDDWEWGVTLFGRRSEGHRDFVY